MPASIDVYREWLKIPDADRPLNYYQLLRVKKFEDDPAKIRQHYRQMNAHVRKFAAGEYQQQSQDLLNELAKAMLCLTDSKRKSEYDASLGRETESIGLRPMEQLVILRKVVDTAALAKARNYANAVGVEIRDALIQQKLAPSDAVNQCYAESLGLAYLDLDDVNLDEDLIRSVPAVLARQNACVPVLADAGHLLMATPTPLSPDVEDELRLRMNVRQVRTVISSASKVNELINRFYPKEAALAQMQSPRVPPGVQMAAMLHQATVAAAAQSAVNPAEAKKRRLMATLMAFNFSMFAVMGVLMFFVYGMARQNNMAIFMKELLIAAPVAGIIAGLTWMGYRG